MIKSFSEIHFGSNKKPSGDHSFDGHDDVPLGSIAACALFPWIVTLIREMLQWIFRGCLSLGGGSCIEEGMWELVNYPGVLAMNIVYQMFGCFHVPGGIASGVPCLENLSGVGYTLGVLMVSTFAWGAVGYVIGGMAGKGNIET